MSLWNKLQDISREDWPQFIKQNYPDVWQELAWTKVNQWRDNQKNQAAVLGDTPDYNRQLFTLDDRATDMVMYAFKKYWQDGLLYKSSYLINWSVGLQTALSDVSGEIEYETRIDPFITFEYRPVAFAVQEYNQDTKLVARLHHYFEENPVQVSTVRPETIFGDVAVAIHPNRLARNLKAAGFSEFEILDAQRIIQQDQLGMELGIEPLGVRGIRLILAKEVEEDFGSGSLKITPASDITDYELFNKYLGGDIPQAIGRDGKLTEIAGLYKGLTREEARVAVIKRLLETGFVPEKTGDSVDEKALHQTSSATSQEGNGDEDMSEFESLKTVEEQYQWLAKQYPHAAVNWNYEHNVSVCERSKAVIEPLISEEFFVGFSRPALSTGKTLQDHGFEGVAETDFYTDDYRTRAHNFVENIHDWCISRDLVWGHRIPVWYNLDVNPDQKFYTASEIQADNSLQNAIKIQAEKPSESGTWVQETKILDTWFSSCLWPLSTLGFYDEVCSLPALKGRVNGGGVLSAQNKKDSTTGECGFTPTSSTKNQTTDFAKFYSTQEMTTAKEIFYLWIVRMIILGKYFTSQLPSDHAQFNKIPFEKVIITPTILDEKGRKMSKSLGNGLDPVAQIEKYSSDALRMAMLSGMTPNRNMKMGGQLADRACEKYRNFGNKLWNITRFLEVKLDEAAQSGTSGDTSDRTTLNSEKTPRQAPPATPQKGNDEIDFDGIHAPSMWILDKFIAVQEAVMLHLSTYEIAHAVDAIYHFVWDEFADWYVEYLKTDQTQISFAVRLFQQIIHFVSPFLPHEAEVLWQQFFQQDSLVAFAVYDFDWAANTRSHICQSDAHGSAMEDGFTTDTDREMHEFDVVVDFVTSIRSARGLFGIDPATQFEVFTQSQLLLRYSDFIKLSARCVVMNEARENLYEVQAAHYHYSLDILSYISDISTEIARTEKQISNFEKQITQLEKQLGNPKFIQHADSEVVAQKRQDLSDREREIHEQKEKLSFLREAK